MWEFGALLRKKIPIIKMKALYKTANAINTYKSLIYNTNLVKQ